MTDELRRTAPDPAAPPEEAAAPAPAAPAPAAPPDEAAVPAALAPPAADTPPGAPAGEPAGRLGFLDAVYGVLFSPERTFSRAGAAPPYGASVAVVAVVAALDGLAVGTAATVGLRFATALAVMLIWLGVGAGALGLMAEWLGGRGRVGTLFALLGLARAPHLVALPLTVLGRSVPALGFLGGALGAVWSLALAVPAVRHAYGVTTPVAVVVLFLGLFLLIAVPVVLILALVAALVSDPGFIQSLQSLSS